MPMSTPAVGAGWALLDVPLDVGVRDGAPFVGVAVEADAVELFLDRLAVFVGELVGVFEWDASGGHGRAEHVGAEPDALLLGESDLDVAQGFDAGVVEGAHHLDAAEDAEGAVEGAAGGDGVDVGAHLHARQGPVAAGAGGVDVADAVDPHLESGLEHPLHAAAAGLGVGVGERQAPYSAQPGRLVVVGADLLQPHQEAQSRSRLIRTVRVIGTVLPC